MQKEAPLVQRVEVITRTERRRRWSDEEKRRFVAESFSSGAVVSHVADVRFDRADHLVQSLQGRPGLIRREGGDPIPLPIIQYMSFEHVEQ